MENIFVLVVLFSVAAVGLLGFFLFASEKELKVKRREIEELVTKFESASPGIAPVQAAMLQPDNSAELAELRARNQELQDQLSGLSGKLESSRRSIQELEAAQQHAEGNQAETQRLRTANDQLHAELNNLRNRLQASESRGTGSVVQNQDATERHAQLQSEITDLKQKLQESHARLGEAEGLRQRAERVDALEAEQRSERQRLQARIAELEREMASSQENLREMPTLQKRLSEAEEAQTALRAESERHEQEIARWRERISEGDEHRQRLAALQAPYEQLLSKQTSLAEQQGEFQNQLAAFARLMATPVQSHESNSSVTAQANTAIHSSYPANESNESSVAPVVALANAQANAPSASQSQEKAKRRFGLFSVIILLAALGFLATQLFTSTSDTPTMPVVSASAVKNRTVTAVTPPQGPAPEVKAVEPAAPEPQPAKEIAKPINEPAKVNAPAKQEARMTGAYQITQASRVYAGPTESSQLLGEIEPGVKVTVVNNRNGWLEIHSKHGRPPGFIRKEVATPLAGQN